MAEKIESNRKWRTVNQREFPRDGATALENWEHWMAERRNIHSRLSNKLGVSPRDLLMNSDEFRQRKILHKAVFERAEEPLAYDKYRGSPNFWIIPEGLSKHIIPKSRLKYCAESGAGIISEEEKLPMIGPSSTGKKFDYKNPEYRGTPRNVLLEKGIDVRDISEHARKNEDERWIDTPYLQEKIKKLPKKLKKIVCSKPDIENVYVTGKYITQKETTQENDYDGSMITRSTAVECQSGAKETSDEPNDPDKEYERSGDGVSNSGNEKDGIDSLSEELEYVKINGEVMQVRGMEEEISRNHEKKVELAFDGNKREIIQKTLTIENICSLEVHYGWHRQQKKNFPNASQNFPQCEKGKSQALKIKNLIESIRPEFYLTSKFFFSKLKGVLLPKQIVQIPIFFCSKEYGLFSERWILYTNPPLKGRNRMGEIEVFLVGFVPLPAKEICLHPIQLEIELRCVELMARRKLNSIIENVTQPKEQYGNGLVGPSLMLINSKNNIEQRDIFKEREIFCWANPPQYHYHPSTIKNLKNLHTEITRKNGRETCWNLSISQLREIIVKMTNSDAKSYYLEMLCNNVDVLLEPYIEDISDDKRYYYVYSLLCRFIDTIDKEIEGLQATYGIPQFTTKAELVKYGPRTNSYGLPTILVHMSEVLDENPDNKSKNTGISLKSYREAVHAMVYGHLSRTVDNICICLETTKNKYLVENKWDDQKLKRF